MLLRQCRDNEKLRWRLEFSPVIEGFPSGDDVADATRINGLVEEMIRKAPSQYLWLHKRFKSRPLGQASLY